MYIHNANWKKFINYKNDGIRYNVYHPNDNDDFVALRMSYYGENIWGIKGIQDQKISQGIWYRDISLGRGEFEKIGLQDAGEAISCFGNAVNEFNKVDNATDFKNKVNIYLIRKANEALKKLENISFINECPKCNSKNIVRHSPPDHYANVKLEGEPAKKNIGDFQKEYYFCYDCKHKWDVED